MKIMVQAAPWTFGIAMFCVSAFVKSQAATLDRDDALRHRTRPARHTDARPDAGQLRLFFLLLLPSDLAAINMDRTGTTHIGKYLLNHSFMIPGLIGVGVSTCVAYVLAKLAFGF